MDAAQAVVPFRAAAHLHTEGPFADVSFTPGATAANLLVGSAGEVVAYPFLRAIWLRVTSSGGAVGTGAPVFDNDAPWRIFDSVQLADANGTALVGGIGTFGGYDLYLANKYGGYADSNDPAGHPDFLRTVQAPQFFLRVPVEINRRTGLGALGNMAANAPFRLTLIGNTQAAIWSTVSTLTTPAIRVRAYLETWTLPAPRNLRGMAQEQIPPGGLGTTQYWRKASPSVTASSQNIVKFTDVGSLIRTWILVARSAAANNSRLTAAAFPDPYTLAWDSNPLIVEAAPHRRQVMADESTILNLSNSTFSQTTGIGSLEDGVLAFSFANPNGRMFGGDGEDAWLPTLQSTRIEFAGAFGASITNLDILTNSVAAVESVSPFSFGSQTGQLVGPAQPSTR